jgi:tRNA threonylcarbamoyladenosine biosynthesis protein TsaB
MMTLALEFSSEQRSVALARGGAVLASAVETGGVRQTNAFGLISKVLAQAHVTREQVEVIALGLGPGSYTGVRAAIAVAQGWQLARAVKLLGISSAEAMALRAQQEGIFGRLNVVVDAQKGEFYLGIWDISADKREEVSPLRIAPAAEVAGLASCIGPAAKTVLFPDAASVAILAAGRSDYIRGNQMSPIYLRETSFVKVSGAPIV